MLVQTLLFTFLSAASLSSAQTVNPDDIPAGIKEQWCNTQKDSCPLICMQTEGATGDPISNECDTKSLSYSCVCSNNQTPNSTEFSQTIPYFLCQQQNGICVNNCNGNSICQGACWEDHPCGATNPKRVNVTTTASTATATATETGGDVLVTGFGDGSGSKGTGAAGHVALQISQVYGLGIVVAGFLAGFTFML